MSRQKLMSVCLPTFPFFSIILSFNCSFGKALSFDVTISQSATKSTGALTLGPVDKDDGGYNHSFLSKCLCVQSKEFLWRDRIEPIRGFSHEIRFHHQRIPIAIQRFHLPELPFSILHPSTFVKHLLVCPRLRTVNNMQEEC